MTKVLVSFDEKLLRRIDRFRAGRGLSRSAYIRELCERDLAMSFSLGKLREKRKKALTKLDELAADSPAVESTEAIRRERNAR
jgi:metal-responsive CopG/Arc/MetJ family transcriptional regulator